MWERDAGDPYDAVWVVIGPPERDGHPCLTLVGERAAGVGKRIEDCDPKSPLEPWEESRYLKRLA